MLNLVVRLMTCCLKVNKPFLDLIDLEKSSIIQSYTDIELINLFYCLRGVFTSYFYISNMSIKYVYILYRYVSNWLFLYTNFLAFKY